MQVRTFFFVTTIFQSMLVVCIFYCVFIVHFEEDSLEKYQISSCDMIGPYKRTSEERALAMAVLMGMAHS